MENNTMEQNPIPINEPQKKLHIQKPNNKVVFGILALFVIALVFILLYIFVLQEGEEQEQEGESTTRNDIEEEKQQEGGQAIIQRARSYYTIVETQNEYEFVYLGTGSDLIILKDLKTGTHLCEFAIKGHPNAEALLAEFEKKEDLVRAHGGFGNDWWYDNEPTFSISRGGEIVGRRIEWNMQDYSTTFLVRSSQGLRVKAQFAKQDTSNTSVQWVVACNQIHLGNQTSFSATGSELQQVFTNLAPDDYKCTLNTPEPVFVTIVTPSGDKEVQYTSIDNYYYATNASFYELPDHHGYDDYNAEFYLSNLSSQEPLVLQMRPEEPSSNAVWSIECNQFELGMKNPALGFNNAENIGPPVLSKSGTGENTTIVFNQPKGFYTCTISTLQNISKNLVYSQPLPGDGQSLGYGKPKIKGSTIQGASTFLISNGMLDTYYLTAIELVDLEDGNSQWRWNIACYALQQNQQNDSVAVQGSGTQDIVTNLKNGDYKCNIDIDVTRNRNIFAPFVYIDVHYFNSYNTRPSRKFISLYYSSRSTLSGNHEFDFSFRQGDIPPVIGVAFVQGIEADWDLSCAEIKPQNRTTEFVKTADTSTPAFITGVQSGTYSCTIESKFLNFFELYLRNKTYDIRDYAGPNSPPLLPGKDDILLLEGKPDQTSASFEFTSTDSLYSPEIVVSVGSEGDHNWVISCKQK